MNKTLIPERRLTDEEREIILKSDIKVFGSVARDLTKIGKKLRAVLPKIQQINCFSAEQVSKFSKLIDVYMECCSDLKEDFENRAKPEEW